MQLLSGPQTFRYEAGQLWVGAAASPVADLHPHWEDLEEDGCGRPRRVREDLAVSGVLRPAAVDVAAVEFETAPDWTEPAFQHACTALAVWAVQSRSAGDVQLVFPSREDGIAPFACLRCDYDVIDWVCENDGWCSCPYCPYCRNGRGSGAETVYAGALACPHYVGCWTDNSGVEAGPLGDDERFPDFLDRDAQLLREEVFELDDAALARECEAAFGPVLPLLSRLYPEGILGTAPYLCDLYEAVVHDLGGQVLRGGIWAGLGLALAEYYVPDATRFSAVLEDARLGLAAGFDRFIARCSVDGPGGG